MSAEERQATCERAAKRLYDGEYEANANWLRGWQALREGLPSIGTGCKAGALKPLLLGHRPLFMNRYSGSLRRPPDDPQFATPS
jgi:hypothetical protein